MANTPVVNYAVGATPSSAANMQSVPIVEQRFSDGMSLAKAAFAQNTLLTSMIQQFANALIQQIHPFMSVPLVIPPTYAELDTFYNLMVPPAPPGESFPALPTIGDAPAIQFQYNESNYESDVKDNLDAALVAKIKTGGTGLGAAVESGIWDREYERAQLERNDAIARQEDDYAAGGFSLPDGAVSMMLLDQETKFEDQRLTSSRDIATKQAELAYDQTTKILELSNSFDATNTTFANEIRNRLLDAAKAGPTIAVEIFRAEVERINAFVAQYNAIAAKANAEAEIFKGQVAAFNAQLDLKKSIIQSSTELFSAKEIAVYHQNETTIQQEQLIVNQITQFLNLQLEALKAETQVNAQIAASALTGMSASASIGGAESQSFGIEQQTSTTTSTQTIQENISYGTPTGS